MNLTINPVVARPTSAQAPANRNGNSARDEVMSDCVHLSGETKAKDGSYRFPAEWEKQDATWLSWPTYQNMVGRPSENVQMDIIRALAPYDVSVNIIAQDDAGIAKIKDTLALHEVPSAKIKYFVVPHNDIWMRDIGPLFVKNAEGELKVVDFNFNTWGYESPDSDNSKVEEAADRLVAERLHVPTIKSEVVAEGGVLEFNGKGTLITTESVALQRNPKMTLPEIEAEYKRLFDLKKVIWLKQGLAEDDQTFKGKLPGGYYTMITTGGHTDEFVRFVDDHHLLLADIPAEERDNDPIAKMSGERLDESLKRLQKATDQSGNALEITRMPTPDPIFVTLSPGDGVYEYIKRLDYEDGSVIKEGEQVKAVLPTSYLNYIVSNDVVIAPKYYEPGRPLSTKRKDEQAKAILEEVFKGRQVVQINPENVNIGGGGMHCITQHQPAQK